MTKWLFRSLLALGVFSSGAHACDVIFDGVSAQKMFIKLYPYTQGPVTAIVAEKTRSGETVIAAQHIFCRVYNNTLPETNVEDGVLYLSGLNPKLFQCGVFVGSDGDLSACSDPQ